jgi:hypothetical protein
MILSTMNDRPGHRQEICAYGTAVKIVPVRSPSS